MSYNFLMPEEAQKSLRPSWVPLWLWRWRWWIAAILFILVWWLVPPLLYSHSGGGTDAKNAQLKAITDTRAALLAGLIGVGALLTFWLNSRVYRITTRTLEVTEQGHITERYTKAIEQLGHTELTIRLGGLYALERIAVDSERDHPTVVEVLSAFVREESHHSTLRAGQGTAQEVAETDTPAPKGWTAPRPATDIQAALTVLGRLPQRAGIPRRADLREVQLSGAQLSGANLSGAGLIGANLSGANLDGANLSGAQLNQANLSGAQLDGANLSGAVLVQVDLSGAWLVEANLSGALLFGANLYTARLSDAVLTEANLALANLSHAKLGGTNLNRTIGLKQPQLDAARGDARTQLPEGLQRPDTWATGEESAPVSS